MARFTNHTFLCPTASSILLLIVSPDAYAENTFNILGPENIGEPRGQVHFYVRPLFYWEINDHQAAVLRSQGQNFLSHI